MQKSPELKEKISKLYEIDTIWWNRIEDYLWNIWYVLANSQRMLDSWIIKQEEVSLMEEEYKKMVDIILLLPIQDIILKLEDNKPSENWTNANIEALKKAFLN